MERLDDDRGDVSMGREDRRGRPEVVVRRDEHVGDGARGDTGGGRFSLRKREEAPREEAHRADLVGAVIRALEFQHARRPV